MEICSLLLISYGVFFFNSIMTKAEAVRLEGSVRTAMLPDLTSLVFTNAAVDGAKGRVRAKDAHCAFPQVLSQFSMSLLSDVS